MTREEIIKEFITAEINFDYTTLKTHDIAVNYIDDAFTPVLDLVLDLVNGSDLKPSQVIVDKDYLKRLEKFFNNYA
jgi:hypothetical protein